MKLTNRTVCLNILMSIFKNKQTNKHNDGSQNGRVKASKKYATNE